MTFISATGLGPTAIAHAPASAATKPTLRPPLSEDTASLSQFAQASQLKLQGQTPSEIADDLEISVSTVDSYFGIPATSATATPGTASTTTSVKSTSTA
jgi:hypothetical protein